MKSVLLAGVAATMAASFGGAAGAEPAAVSVAPASSDGEIVVTARRREESLQKVPLSITAFSQQTLKEKSISQAYDLDRAVPGLSVVSGSGAANQAQTSFAIRGRGQNYGAAAGSVETYFADVPLSGPFQMPAMGPVFFDLQSLQVLKGPQGTLFGRSTTGGAVLLVPQAPTAELGGFVRAQVGDYGNYQFEGAINIPILGDKAVLRLAGFEWHRDGYGRTLGSNAGASPILGPFRDPFGTLLLPQTYDNQDTQQFRATLLLKPVEGLRNSTIFAYNRDNSRAVPKAAVFDPTTQLGGGALFLYPYLDSLPAHMAATDVNLDHPASHNWAIINTTEYELTPNLTVKNIFGHINATGISNQANDADGTPIGGIDLPTPPRRNKAYQTTNELQLLGHNFDDRLKWIVGGLIDVARGPGGDNISIFTILYSGSFDVLWQQNRNTGYGLYGSATYNLTSKLSLTVGARHSWYDINIFTQEAVAPTATIYLANARLTPGGATAANGWNVINAGQSDSASYQGDTYNLGAEYQADADTLVYGGYRRGFKPGGFNAKAPIGNAALASFAPETDDDFYLGLKKNFNLGGVPGRFNVEGYWDLYHGKQVSYLTLTQTGNAAPTLATATLNVPGTTYRGFDVDTVIDPTRWLRLSANYSFIDAYFTNWPDITFPGYTANLAVNPVAFVSRNKFSINARLHAELPGGKGELAFAPTVSYQDKLYAYDNGYLLPRGSTFYLGRPADFNTIGNGGIVLPARTIVDLRIEWNQVMGSRVDAAVNVVNLTDAVYPTGATGTLAFGTESRSYGQPRMFTFELSTKF